MSFLNNVYKKSKKIDRSENFSLELNKLLKNKAIQQESYKDYNRNNKKELVFLSLFAYFLLKMKPDLYSLNYEQLKNLLDKNIQFGFFLLEDKASDTELKSNNPSASDAELKSNNPSASDTELKSNNPSASDTDLKRDNPLTEGPLILKKAKKTTDQELLLELKNQDLKQPLVLLCEEGERSCFVAKNLRDKGFINVYFVSGGVKALLKESPL